MLCRECKGSLYDKRSDLCLACGAVQTLKEEFKESWPSGRLREIAADLTVSALRSVRVLRIFGKSPGRGLEKEPVREPLERKRQRSADRPERAEAPLKVRPVTPEKRRDLGRGGPAQSSRPETGQGRRGRSSSYYSPTSSDFEVKDLTQGKSDRTQAEETRGATPKAKVQEKEPFRQANREKRSDSRDKGVRQGERGALARPVQATCEVGSEEDKRRSKEAYLTSQKHQITLREGPKEERQPAINQNLLEIVGDRVEKDNEKAKRRRRRRGA